MENTAETQPEPEQSREANEIKAWYAEIDDAKKRAEDYCKQGDRVLGIYASTDRDRTPFNILYSNTDTLLPAYYSATPRPDVQRRFKDDDPIGKAASDAGERMLAFLLDTNVDGYETFDEAIKASVFDALLPGRGVTAVKYDAEIGEYDAPGEEGEEAGEQEPLIEKKSELVCLDSQPWNQVLFGFAKKWPKVPWIAFEQSIDRAEAERLFGHEMAEKIKFTRDNVGPDEDDKTSEEEHQGERKTATIYQIWDKDGGRKVRYVSRHYKDGFLKVDDDPLELTGFFPIPRPLQFVANNDFNTVTAPYLVYENQAKELNELTRRLTRISRAIKAKGVYDGELGEDIKNLLEGDDNEFIPADKSSMLNQNGFDKAIWFMPVEKLIVVLQQLYQAREQCKQVIYEITGISDIIRGSTVASETATAQDIKSRWGTMRLGRGQGEVQRYARDILRLMLEIAASKFSEDTWAKMTGLPYLTQAQAAAQAMVPPQPGQEQPITWAQVLALLKSDLQRAYRIDIETDSTIAPEQREDQQAISEAMTALGQYIQGVTPLVQQGVMPFEAAKTLMIAFIRRFKFGDQVEDYLKQMQPPQPPKEPEDNTLQVKQLEMQSKQAELEAGNQLEAVKLEAQRVIEQGKAATEMRIEEMRIESAERIARMQAEIDAEVRLQIAAMQQQNQPAEVMQ
jgi:hypothetical protein